MSAMASLSVANKLVGKRYAMIVVVLDDLRVRSKEQFDISGGKELVRCLTFIRKNKCQNVAIMRLSLSLTFLAAADILVDLRVVLVVGWS